MTTKQKTQMRLQVATDQCYKHMDGYLADIRRIAAEGPNGSERDQLLIRAVCHSAAGDIRQRRIAITEAEQPNAT